MERYFVLLIILVASFLYFKYAKIEGMQNCSDKTIYHFLHTVAAAKYSDVVKEFGQPTIFVDEPGGVAIWKGADMFTSIMLKDEAVGHMEPTSHCDFLYATITVHISDAVLPLILSISKSMYYDRLKKELVCRCSSMNAIVATLWLAMTMLENPEKEEIIAKEYADAVYASSQKVNYTKMYHELKKMVSTNHTQFAEELDKRECVFTYGAGQSSSLMR